MQVEIPQAREVLEYFDVISYSKGCSVIRMLQNFLGEEVFQVKTMISYLCAKYIQKRRLIVNPLTFDHSVLRQKSLASYMKKFGFSNAKTEDLWSVISETSGIEINRMMNMWTKQKGYPVLTVKLKGTTCEFDQVNF